MYIAPSRCRRRGRTCRTSLRNRWLYIDLYVFLHISTCLSIYLSIYIYIYIKHHSDGNKQTKRNERL